MDPARLRAKVHQVEVAWRLRTSREVTVGPEPRLVLAVRARRDVEVLLVRADFPALLHAAEGQAESILAEVPHAIGLRQLRPEGEPWVWGQEDVDPAAMELALPDHVRSWGGLVQEGVYNVCAAPNDYWLCRCRILVPRGRSLGVIVRADRPMPCRVRLAGV